MVDLSKYSDEQLEEIASRKKLSNYSDQELMEIANRGIQPESQGNYFANLARAVPGWAKGLTRGVGQTIGDVSASIGNLPAEIIERSTGKRPWTIPHPDLLNKNSGSISEMIAERIGKEAPYWIPGGLGIKAASGANKLYRAANAGRQLPLLTRIGIGTGTSGLAGAAINDENRALGAAEGAATYAIPATIGGAKKLLSKNLAKGIQEEYSRLGEHFAPRFNEPILAGEKSGANEFLKKQSADLKLLKTNKEDRSLVDALENYNKKPSISGGHNAQSLLGAIERKYQYAKKGTKEHRIFEEAKKTKNRLNQNISESFEKAGSGEHGKSYQKAREDFAKSSAHYLNNPTIADLISKNPSIRKNKFSKFFFSDEKNAEKFIKEMEHMHPDLANRELVSNIMPWIKYGAPLAALTIGGGKYLPYLISKIIEKAPIE